MKTHNLMRLLGALSLIACASYLLPAYALAAGPNPSLETWTTMPDFIVAQNTALTLRHLASARSDLAKNDIADARAEIAAAEISLREAVLENARNRSEAAKASLERASNAIERALKDSSIKGRNELEHLRRDIRLLIDKSAQGDAKVGSAIAGVWKRAESLTERALDYEMAGWSKFQSSGSDANDVIEAKLHVAYAEIYESTTGEKAKAAAELDKAEAYIEKARQSGGIDKQVLDKVEKEIKTTKANIGKNDPGQNQRYAMVKDVLSNLIQ